MPTLEQLYGLGLIPVVVALVEWLKAAWPELPARWHPVAALTFGVGLNVLLALILATPVGVAAFLGLLVGLAAGGFYGLGKATVLGR